jgi:hypothetical protein
VKDEPPGDRGAEGGGRRAGQPLAAAVGCDDWWGGWKETLAL